MTDTTTRLLPPYVFGTGCPKCGATRGLTEKWGLRYHDAREADIRGTTCDLGGPTEHLHRSCIHCSYEWIEAIVGEAALSADELRDVRELLRMAHESGAGAK